MWINVWPEFSHTTVKPLGITLLPLGLPRLLRELPVQFIHDGSERAVGGIAGVPFQFVLESSACDYFSAGVPIRKGPSGRCSGQLAKSRRKGVHDFQFPLAANHLFPPSPLYQLMGSSSDSH